MAGLSQRQPSTIAHLFNERPKVLKRGVSQKTAVQYRQTLQNAGLACHITKTSLSPDTGKVKSFSSRDTTPVSPSFSKSHKSIDNPTLHRKVENQESYQFHFPEHGWLIDLTTLTFLLPQKLKLKTVPTNLPPATIGQRIWSTVATFFHGFYMGYVLTVPVIFVVCLYLKSSDAVVTRSQLIDAIRGGSMMLGMISATLLLPMLWRGHSFGQRAMGIMVVPTTGEDVDDLSGLAIILRRLTFRTRCVNNKKMPYRPWNSALIPFAGIIVLHFAMIPFTGAFLWLTGYFDHNIPGNIRSPSHHETTVNLTTPTRHILHQIDPAIRSYIIESGMTPRPLTRKVFKEALRYLPGGLVENLLKKMDDGHLKLRGNLFEYQIGIYENGGWTVLNEQGEICRKKEL